MVIDDEIRAGGGSPDRESRQRVGNEIHLVKGQRWLCEKVLERVNGKEFIVIDGLRFPEDHAYFAEAFGARFLHVHIASSDEVRRVRYNSISPGDIPFEAANDQPVEAEIERLAPLASATIANESTLGELENAIVGCVRDHGPKDTGCLLKSS